MNVHSIDDEGKPMYDAPALFEASTLRSIDAFHDTVMQVPCLFLTAGQWFTCRLSPT